jgi:putative tryptophan/tyrosine transport system substrate-binding protein
MKILALRTEGRRPRTGFGSRTSELIAQHSVLCVALCALLSTLCVPAEAQQPGKIPHIGFLSLSGANQEAFRQGLRDLGYIEGKNIAIDSRAAANRTDRLSVLAGELVDLKVDVIVAAGSQAVGAAQRATKSIPIVMTSSSDPVGTGFVASLAHPGGNITGLSLLGPDLSTKRLEMLKEIVLGVSRVAVFWNPDDPAAKISLRETEDAAKALALHLQILETREASDFQSAFRAASKERARALILLPAPIMSTQAKQIAELALKNNLPAISTVSEFPNAGGLMSYGANLAELYRRAATYVDKILKGTKPTDLPVEQPTKFEFIVNLKAAKQIGLTIPPNVLVRADKVIR